MLLAGLDSEKRGMIQFQRRIGVWEFGGIITCFLAPLFSVGGMPIASHDKNRTSCWAAKTGKSGEVLALEELTC